MSLRRASRAPESQSRQSSLRRTSTMTPILLSMLHSSSISASRREERVQKDVSGDHDEPGETAAKAMVLTKPSD